MESQQSFHPFLSNATLYDRMFRYKPYTKCIECLSNDKLKCRKCMQNIIEEISKSDGHKKAIRVRNVSTNLLKEKGKKDQSGGVKNCLSVNRLKENKENIMVTSKYNWWLAQRIKRRQSDVDLKSTWPRKLRFNDKNFQNFGAKQPKFEKWQRKLLDKFLLKKKNTQ